MDAIQRTASATSVNSTPPEPVQTPPPVPSTVSTIAPARTASDNLDSQPISLPSDPTASSQNE